MKEINPEVIRGGRIIGPQPMQLMVSQLCVNCFPKTSPAIFMWYGMSLCQGCFTPQRKAADLEKAYSWRIEQRNYKETWGEDPITDAEVI